MTILLALGMLAAQDASDVLVLKGAAVVTMAGNDVENGVVIVEAGRIRRVAAEAEIPPGAKVIELSKTAQVLPGFVDLHSHLGSAFDAEEPTEAVTPQVKAVEAFSSRHPDVVSALGSGVTTVALAPGNGNVVGGRVGVVKLNGARYDRALLRDCVALKASLGREALKRDREPTSHAGAVRILRELLKTPRGDLGALPVFLHVETSAEIQSALDLRESSGVALVLLHAREAGQVVRLKGPGTTVAFGPLSTGDPRDVLETPAALAKSGVRLAFVSDAPASPEEHLRVTAAFAVKYGLDRREALRALTVVPAESLGLSKQLGSIEAGKDADLVVWSGDPLTLTSSVELVVINGAVTYRKKDKP